MSLSNDLQAMPKLIAEIVEQLGKLVQNEAQIARAELSEKLDEAGTGISFIAGAAVLAIPALVILMMALAYWLVAFGMTQPTAFLVVAAIGLAGSAILGVQGLRRLRPDNLIPHTTIREMQRDVATAKEALK